MNSYNENLHDQIVKTLQKQLLTKRQLVAKRNAAMFSLYYSQGACITAEERLASAKETYSQQQDIHRKAVKDENIATSLLSSANQELTYVARAVTNAATSTANIQVATNAIVKLAGDIASIYSIVSAEDFGTDIYNQAKYANDLMTITAYEAERASQLAMEASGQTAQISSNKVAQEAKETQKKMADLLAIVNADLSKEATMVANNLAESEKASNAEKKAEGMLEEVNVEDFAAQAAYHFTNKELNLNLSVTPYQTKRAKYKVHFQPYTCPFHGEETDGRNLCNPTEKNNKEENFDSYPVEAYYIFLVKNTLKSIFSIATAEELKNKEGMFKSVNAKNVIKGWEGVRLGLDDLKDSDGDPMRLGIEYVVFVLAELKNGYKKNIDSFEDYLTAASSPFMLAKKLHTATRVKVKPRRLSKKSYSEEIDQPIAQILTFDANNDSNVEYRCMFLPLTIDKKPIKGFLTKKGLKYFEQDDKKNDQKGKNVHRKPGFFFNLNLAEHVSPANYFLPQLNIDSDKSFYSYTLDEETTDNFGNRLVEGEKYLPVVLTISNEPESNRASFASALSNLTQTSFFTYFSPHL